MPGGTAAMAQSLGIAPTPERARFVAELARLTHPSSESAATTRARAAAVVAARGRQARRRSGRGGRHGADPADRRHLVARRLPPLDCAGGDRRRDPGGSSRGASLPWPRGGSTTRRCSTWPITRRWSRVCTSTMRPSSPDSAAACAFTRTGWCRLAAPTRRRCGRRSSAKSWIGRHRFSACSTVRTKDAWRISTTPSRRWMRRGRRSRSACGSRIPPHGRSGSRRWPLVNRTSFPQWQPAKLPFTRPLYDVGSMLARIQAEPDGSPSFPAVRSWWNWAFDGGELPPAAAHPESPVDDGPVDAAWLAEAIASGDVRSPKRAARSVRIRPAGVRRRRSRRRRRRPDGDPRLPALPHADADARADGRAARRPCMPRRRGGRSSCRRSMADRAFVALGQFQGALALIARLTRVRTLDVAAAEALVTSLSSVPLNQDGRYAGGVASWMQQALRPAIPRADDIDNALFPALAGAPSAGDQPRRLDRLGRAALSARSGRRGRAAAAARSREAAERLPGSGVEPSGHLAEAVGGSARGAGRGGRRRDAERAGGGLRAAGRRLRRRVEQRRPSARRRRSGDRGSRPDHGAGRQRESRPDRRGARRHRRRGAGRRADGVGLRHLDCRPGESRAAHRPRHPPPRFRPRSRGARPSAAPGVGGAQGGGHRPASPGTSVDRCSASTWRCRRSAASTANG